MYHRTYICNRCVHSLETWNSTRKIQFDPPAVIKCKCSIYTKQLHFTVAWRSGEGNLHLETLIQFGISFGHCVVVLCTMHISGSPFL